MEERSLAILMGLHIRLAQSSVMRLLDDNTVSLVISFDANTTLKVILKFAA